jgi:histidinol-phosphate phosphatase family protein
MSTSETSCLSPTLRFTFSPFPREGIGPAIFLDRDGVINEQIAGGYVTRWSQFRFVPGIMETLASIAELHLPMIVVSNQAAVEKGILASSDLAAITQCCVDRLQEAGARIDAVYYCPHRPEQACPCRKPREGLLRKAAAEWRVDLSHSVLIGDSMTDVDAALAVSCRAILLDRTGSRASEPAIGAITVTEVSEIAAAVRKCLR